MSLSQYQSIVEGFASGSSQRSQSAGERFSSAKEGFLEKAGNLRNLVEQAAENKYSNLITQTEDAYDATLGIYNAKVKKYQSDVLKELGISEEDQAKATTVMSVAAGMTPLLGQVGGFIAKRLNTDPKDLVKNAKKSLIDKTKSAIRTEGGRQGGAEEVDTEFGGADINEPLPSSTASTAQPPTIEPEASPPVEIEMQPMTRGGRLSAQALQDQQSAAQSAENKATDTLARQVEQDNAERLGNFQRAGGIGENAASGEGEAGEAAAEAATTEAEQAAEEVGTAAAETAGIGLGEIAAEAIPGIGAVVGLGLSVYELGQAFDLWGSNDKTTPEPVPKAPKAPDLEDIPKPRNIEVKDTAPSKSISVHYNTLSAPSINSNIMRR